MKRLIILILAFLSGSVAFAQNPSDALRYSQLYWGGTARFDGLGGAFGAVGADFSVVSTNPAGIGLYKSTELTLSPSLFFNHSLSSYNNSNVTDDKTNVGLGNVGFVFTLPNNSGKDNAFNRINVGFGVNRLSDFNNRISIEGNNRTSSLLTEFNNILNNSSTPISPGSLMDQFPFDIGLAYQTDLIDTVGNVYHSDFGDAPPATRLISQSKLITTTGSINEFDISVASNWQDKLYFGATIGIPFIRYYERSHYEEVSKDTSIHYFRSFTYDQYIETHGTGINLKVGLIYRPADWIRIGAAIHTPTYYGNMRDSWNSSMTSNLVLKNAANKDTAVTYSQDSPVGNFDYQMTTPFRAIGSLAFIIGSYGLITGEYEYVNYNQARFDDSDKGFKDENGVIKTTYTSPVIVRAGTEWRILNLRIRGGFGYYGSPYKTGNKTGEMYRISGGVGYRGKSFFCDLTYLWSQMKDTYYLYDPAVVNPSNNTYTGNSVVATLGVRF